MKKGCVIGCIAVAAVFLVFAGIFLYMLLGSNPYTTEDIAYYQSLSGETDCPNTLPILGEQIDISCPYDLPLLRELEPCEDYRFNYTARRMAFFESHAYILIVRFDAETYEAKKAALDGQYIFLSEQIRGEAGDVSPEFMLDGFSFRAVDGGTYPKEMFLLGTSDEAREVAVIYYYDQDLDYISPTMEQFLREETGWNEVVK